MAGHLKYAALCALMLMLCGCAGRKSPAAETEVTTTISIEPAPYRTVVNPDFRNILWGMRVDEIYAQENSDAEHFYLDIGAYCEANGLETPDINLFNSDYKGAVVEFYDTAVVGFKCRVFYYFNDQGDCTSGEYVISPEEKEKHGDICMDTINNYFDDMYCPAEMSPVPGYIYRRLQRTEIFIGEPSDGSVHIFFRECVFGGETSQTSRKIEFDNGTTIIRN